MAIRVVGINNQVRSVVMRNRRFSFSLRRMMALGALVALILVPANVAALGSPDPSQSGSVGLEGRISSEPPSQAATITTPSQGQTFTNTPITIAGLCNGDVIVKIFSNNVFIGSAVCSGGSYSLRADLFSGRNDLVARVYDSFDQAGPDSNVVSVTFNDAQYAQFGTRVSLSSVYARRGANPGTQLDWPIVLSGGIGPYAITVDWGDGTDPSLFSREFAGDFTATHVYATAGVYRVVIKASDKNGTSAYLQLVGIGNGEAGTTIVTRAQQNLVAEGGFFDRFGLWLFLITLILMLIVFWLGSRHELYVVRRRIERSRDDN